jgi:hypothetical protein
MAQHQTTLQQALLQQALPLPLRHWQLPMQAVHMMTITPRTD